MPGALKQKILAPVFCKTILLPIAQQTGISVSGRPGHFRYVLTGHWKVDENAIFCIVSGLLC